MPQQTDKQINGDQATQDVEPGVEAMPEGSVKKPLLPIGEKTTGDQVNEELIEEINQKIMAIDPDIFKGVIQELADLIEDFKTNLSTFEMLQYTQPDAYNNLLSIMGTMTTLAQLMMQNGDLPSDSDVVSAHANQDLMQHIDQKGDEASQKTAEATALKSNSKKVPIGTIANNGAGGKPRIKTQDGWKYVTRGLGAQGAGRPKTNFEDGQ